MAAMNKVILLGHLTRDPELRYTHNGTAVTAFGLAVNHRLRQGDDTRDEVCFIDVTVFGRQAETTAESLHKGAPALVEGRLRWRSWETDEGQKRSKHDVLAETVQFLATRRNGSAAHPEGAGGEPPALPEEEDDIPFVRADSDDSLSPSARRTFLA
jgi:single-strand DNA-binding protein